MALIRSTRGPALRLVSRSRFLWARSTRCCNLTICSRSSSRCDLRVPLARVIASLSSATSQKREDLAQAVPDVFSFESFPKAIVSPTHRGLLGTYQLFSQQGIAGRVYIYQFKTYRGGNGRHKNSARLPVTSVPPHATTSKTSRSEETIAKMKL